MNSPQQTVSSPPESGKLSSLYPNRSGASRNLPRWLRLFDVGPHFETQSANRNNFVFLIAFSGTDNDFKKMAVRLQRYITPTGVEYVNKFI